MSKTRKFLMVSVGGVAGLMIIGMIVAALTDTSAEEVKSLNLIAELAWYRVAFLSPLLLPGLRSRVTPPDYRSWVICRKRSGLRWKVSMPRTSDSCDRSGGNLHCFWPLWRSCLFNNSA